MNMSNTFTVMRPLRSVRLSDSNAEGSELTESEAESAALVQAREEGYQAGIRDSEAAQNALLEEIKNFQTNTLQSLSKQEDSLFSEAEEALPELILEGVRRIIADWKPKAKEIEKLVQEILAGLEGDSGPVRVFLNPIDKKHMLSLHKNLERDFPEVTILEDTHLRSGECYARGRFGITDGRFSAKLENMRKVFL